MLLPSLLFGVPLLGLFVYFGYRTYKANAVRSDRKETIDQTRVEYELYIRQHLHLISLNVDPESNELAASAFISCMHSTLGIERSGPEESDRPVKIDMYPVEEKSQSFKLKVSWPQMPAGIERIFTCSEASLAATLADMQIFVMTTVNPALRDERPHVVVHMMGILLPEDILILPKRERRQTIKLSPPPS